jgi:hypothetical protein
MVSGIAKTDRVVETVVFSRFSPRYRPKEVGQLAWIRQIIAGRGCKSCLLEMKLANKGLYQYAKPVDGISTVGFVPASRALNFRQCLIQSALQDDNRASKSEILEMIMTDVSGHVQLAQFVDDSTNVGEHDYLFTALIEQVIPKLGDRDSGRGLAESAGYDSRW